MTLDLYGHLFEDRLDEVADAMDRARDAARMRRASAKVLPRVAPVSPRPDLGGDDEAALDSLSAGQDRFSEEHSPTIDEND